MTDEEGALYGRDHPAVSAVPPEDAPEPVLTLSEPVSETETGPDLREQAGSVESDSSDTVAVGEEPEEVLLAGLRSGDWLDAQQFPPLRWAIPGLLPEGFTLLVAPPKAGKSWLALGWLLAIAAGGVALGRLRLPHAADVLYLALEDGDRRMQSRARTLLGPNDPIPPRFHYVTRLPPGPGSVLAVIDAYLQRYPDTAMVVIDTLGKVMPPALSGESSYQRDYKVGGALKGIADARPGLSVVVIHHDRKASSEDFVDSVSGTHGLAGAADAVMVLQRARQSTEGVLRVTGRDVPEEAYAVVLDGIGSWHLDGLDLVEAARRVRARAEERKYSETSSEILDFIRDGGRSGRTAQQVRDKFGDSADKYLSRRVADGALVKPKRGLYVVPDVVSEPVSEVSETTEAQVTPLFRSDTAPSEVSETPPEQ